MKAKADMRCLPQLRYSLSSTLVFETVSLALQLELTVLDRLATRQQVEGSAYPCIVPLHCTRVLPPASPCCDYSHVLDHTSYSMKLRMNLGPHASTLSLLTSSLVANPSLLLQFIAFGVVLTSHTGEAPLTLPTSLGDFTPKGLRFAGVLLPGRTPRP